MRPRAETVRRTPLVAGGFLVGALLGALPPMQAVSQRFTCVAKGGAWIAETEACQYRVTRPFALPAPSRERENDLLEEEVR